VLSQIEGDKAKITFIEGNNQMAKEGNYLLVHGSKMYMVDTKEKTYMEYDIDQMAAMAGGLMEGMKGIMNFKFTDPEVKKLAERDGGGLLGYPVRYYKHRTSYGMEMKVIGMKRYSEVETIQESWTTSKLNASAFYAWLRRKPPTTGQDDLDKLIAAEFEKISGVPLKTVAVTTTKEYNRKRTKVKDETRTVTETIVDSIKKASFPASTFEIPKGYERVELFGGEEGEEGGNPFKKIFGGKN
jgi:hypothetical protein